MKRKVKSTRWKLVDSMFWSLFVTGAVIEFSDVGSAFIDGLVISRFFGSEAMAAQGIAHPIFSIVGVLSGLIAAGMQITCSQLMGRGQVKEVNRYVSQSVIVGAVVSVLVAAAVLIFPTKLAVLLGASGKGASLVLPASQYLFGIGVGIPAQLLVAILAPAIQMDSGRKFIRNGALLCSVSDVVLDLLAVYFDLGLLGAGLATAQLIQTDVDRDAVHPCGKARFALKARKGTVDAQHGLLCAVEGILPVAAHAQRDSIHPVFVLAHQLLKRGEIPVSRKADHFLLIHPCSPSFLPDRIIFLTNIC